MRVRNVRFSSKGPGSALHARSRCCLALGTLLPRLRQRPPPVVPGGKQACRILDQFCGYPCEPNICGLAPVFHKHILKKKKEEGGERVNIVSTVGCWHFDRCAEEGRIDRNPLMSTFINSLAHSLSLTSLCSGDLQDLRFGRHPKLIFLSNCHFPSRISTADW